MLSTIWFIRNLLPREAAYFTRAFGRPCIPIKTCRRLYVNPETAYSNVLPLEVAISKHNLKNGILIKQTAFLYVLLFVMYNPSVGYTLLLGHPNTFFQVTVYKHNICVRGNRHYSYKHY